MHQLKMALVTFGLPIVAEVVGTRFGVDIHKTNPMLEFAAELPPEKLLLLFEGLSPEQEKKFAPVGQAILHALPDDKKQEIAKLMIERGAARQQAPATESEGT
jgi:hypothetical protein